MHARHLQRRARIDAADVGVGVRRAHDRGMKLIGELEVVVEAAAPVSRRGSSRRRTD
jgi:hypothetical protein